MLDESELELVRARLHEAYPNANPFTEPIREKLARYLYKKERCEALVDRATQALKSDAWMTASPAEKEAFIKNLRLTKDRIQELSKLIRRYGKSLDINERCLAPTNERNQDHDPLEPLA